MSIEWDDLVLGPVMAVFGENAEDQVPTYRPAGGTPFLLADVVYDEAYFNLDADQGGPATGTTKPIIGVRLSLFPAPPKANDKITIPRAGCTFIVKDVEVDGHGHAKLSLMFASTP